MTEPEPVQEVTLTTSTVVPDEVADAEKEPPRISTILGPLPVGVSPSRTRSLNDTVHQILVIGLGISTVLLLIGLGLEAIRRIPIPPITLPVGQAMSEALRLRPAGFLSLGLLVLMFTPVVRVIGSIVVFIWERDRRYALITFVVLVIMLTSVLLGEG